MSLFDLLEDGQPRIREDHPLEAEGKSAQAFKTISEVSEMLDVPQHVLRFWESKFPQIKPMKRNGGRRYYRPQDVATLVTIKQLLYKEGYTIKGARKAFNGKKNEHEDTPKEVAMVAAAEASLFPVEPLIDPEHEQALAAVIAGMSGGESASRDELLLLRSDLVELRDLLRSVA